MGVRIIKGIGKDKKKEAGRNDMARRSRKEIKSVEENERRGKKRRTGTREK